MNKCKLIIFSVLLSLFSCKGGSQNDLQNSIIQFTSYMNNKNIKVNDLIHKNVGIIFIYGRAGGPCFAYNKLDSITFNEKYYIEKWIPYWWAEKLIEFQFNDEVVVQKRNTDPFECETIYQNGVFDVLDSNKNILSEEIKTMLGIEEYSEIRTLLETDYGKYKQIERYTHRIVFTSKENNLIFICHFFLDNGKYYVYLIDFWTCDCSA